ncbi:hypothetical protein [Sulfolobus acidocaldarius]|uniref:Conserved protein n=4 Tax=Sulfolobus acidocaldarius TaxID=2285 RepID=Q4JA85_SULAC|nr:hypothetical protein [Sulfolobus acidocaldarius]AAY80295.1 conserved protein [Sulfolobus acidocaldarius DSM 639]
MPTVIKRNTDNYVVYIAVIPPLITHGEIIQKLSSSMDIQDACRGYSKAMCYCMVYGGIVVEFENGEFTHITVEGFVSNGSNGDVFTLNKFLQNPYSCYAFNEDVLCFSLSKPFGSSRFIDNIGLRYIID